MDRAVGQMLHPSDQIRGYVEHCRRFHSVVLEEQASVHGYVLVLGLVGRPRTTALGGTGDRWQFGGGRNFPSTINAMQQGGTGLFEGGDAGIGKGVCHDSAITLRWPSMKRLAASATMAACVTLQTCAFASVV